MVIVTAKTRELSLASRVFRIVAQIGPDFPEVARRAGRTDNEVVEAYERLVEGGLYLQTVPAYNRLGLVSSLARVRFGIRFRQYAVPILVAMSDLSYLTRFSRELGSTRDFVFYLRTPPHILSEVGILLDHLREIGLFESIDLLTFERERYAPFDLKNYNLAKAKWRIDWDELTESVPTAHYSWPGIDRRAAFEYVDLLILKELQIDPAVQPEGIAEKLKLDPGQVKDHFSSVATPGGLVKEYRFRWVGMKPPWHHKEARFMYASYHPAMSFALLAKNPSSKDMGVLRTALNRIPFLQYEALGRDYLALVVLPPEWFSNLLYYLDDSCSNVETNVQSWIEDPRSALTFTIPYRLYNQNLGRWMFDRQNLSSRFDDLVAKIAGAPPGLHPLTLELSRLPPGRRTWRAYQDLCGRILDFCLVPPLSTPLKEWRTYSGLQRLDLAYPIPYDSTGIWEHIRMTHASTSLVVECKNYSRNLEQNEVYMTSKYFGPKKAGGSFGVMLSRKGLSSSAQKEQLELWKLHDQIILCLSDADLNEMIDLKSKGLKPEEVIARKYREFRQLV